MRPDNPRPVSSRLERRQAFWTVQITVAFIGLVRVADDPRDVARQHHALDPICTRVFEETASRRRLIKNRPQLLAAMGYLGPDDVLVVTKANHLAQSMIDGFDVLNDLFERGIAVKVLEGIAAGDHNERSLILDAGRDITTDRRGNLSWCIKAGLEAARDRGVVGGRPRVIDDDERAVIIARREKGESIRTIAKSLGISAGTVHKVLANEATVDPRQPGETSRRRAAGDADARASRVRTARAGRR